jgi:hypothetical protein
MALSDNFWMPHQRFMASPPESQLRRGHFPPANFHPATGHDLATTTTVVDRRALSNAGRTKITRLSILETPNELCAMSLLALRSRGVLGCTVPHKCTERQHLRFASEGVDLLARPSDTIVFAISIKLWPCPGFSTNQRV